MTRCNNTGELPTKKKKTTTRVNNERLKWFDSKKKKKFSYSAESEELQLFFSAVELPTSHHRAISLASSSIRGVEL